MRGSAPPFRNTGEINDSQKEQWIRAIEVFDEDEGGSAQMKLFAAERPGSFARIQGGAF
jgi:hypothetical protein